MSPTDASGSTMALKSAVPGSKADGMPAAARASPAATEDSMFQRGSASWTVRSAWVATTVVSRSGVSCASTAPSCPGSGTRTVIVSS